jgi:glutamate-1-semialdehyde 2,1-aminomutase
MALQTVWREENAETSGGFGDPIQQSPVATKLVTRLTEADRRLVARAVEGFVPERVFDLHAHLFHTRHFAEGKRPSFLQVDTAFGISAWRSALGRWLPGRKIEGLFFGFPSAGNDRAGENEFLAGEIDPVRGRTNHRALALVAPEDDPAIVRAFVRHHGFVGLKPYRLYASMEDTAQAEIEAFVPRWMWELCHEIEGVLMIHLVRSAALADPHNLAALERLCGEFPRCRVVLAHVGRCFNYRHATDGLPRVVALENVVVDTSTITESAALRAALEILGPRRVLFGSDYMVSELRAKCCTMGDGFAWVYADELPSAAVTAFENFTLIGIESLLCLREACESCGLGEADVRDVFHDNALRLLAPHRARR